MALEIFLKWSPSEFHQENNGLGWLRAHRRSNFSVLLGIAVSHRLISSPRPLWTVKVLFWHFFIHAALFITPQSHFSWVLSDFGGGGQWGISTKGLYNYFLFTVGLSGWKQRPKENLRKKSGLSIWEGGLSSVWTLRERRLLRDLPHLLMLILLPFHM